MQSASVAIISVLLALSYSAAYSVTNSHSTEVQWGTNSYKDNNGSYIVKTGSFRLQHNEDCNLYKYELQNWTGTDTKHTVADELNGVAVCTVQGCDDNSTPSKIDCGDFNNKAATL